LIRQDSIDVNTTKPLLSPSPFGRGLGRDI
jgi:hypothetical protein